MNFDKVPDSERINNIDKAHAMANSGKKYRDTVLSIKKHNERFPDGPHGILGEEHYKNKAEWYENESGFGYEEERVEKMNDAELAQLLSIIQYEQERRRRRKIEE